mmetsp:Transcript_21217/g.63870  ORF Transcript_21217/g.63870 Transcript_21217/m.63870 type:complete len:434 (-) Transcript_21217:466-1767(-)
MRQCQMRSAPLVRARGLQTPTAKLRNRWCLARSSCSRGTASGSDTAAAAAMTPLARPCRQAVPLTRWSASAKWTTWPPQQPSALPSATVCAPSQLPSPTRAAWTPQSLPRWPAGGRRSTADAVRLRSTAHSGAALRQCLRLPRLPRIRPRNSASSPATALCTPLCCRTWTSLQRRHLRRLRLGRPCVCASDCRPSSMQPPARAPPSLSLPAPDPPARPSSPRLRALHRPPSPALARTTRRPPPRLSSPLRPPLRMWLPLRPHPLPRPMLPHPQPHHPRTMRRQCGRTPRRRRRPHWRTPRPRPQPASSPLSPPTVPPHLCWQPPQPLLEGLQQWLSLHRTQPQRPRCLSAAPRSCCGPVHPCSPSPHPPLTTCPAPTPMPQSPCSSSQPRLTSLQPPRLTTRSQQWRGQTQTCRRQMQLQLAMRRPQSVRQQR